MSLERIAHTWNSTEDTPEFTDIPLHIILMSKVEGLKREIDCLKETIINQLQGQMEKRGFYSMEKNQDYHLFNAITNKKYHGVNSEED